jgi:hypothetical protein
VTLVVIDDDDDDDDIVFDHLSSLMQLGLRK